MTTNHLLLISAIFFIIVVDLLFYILY